MVQAHVRITRVDFLNFKAFRKYSVTLRDVNILVGPNNSGKSTIIGALRTLDAAIRTARSRSPSRVYIGNDVYIGYHISKDSVPISLENVQTDYNGAEARVTFFLSNGNSLALVFPGEGGCLLIPTVNRGILNNVSTFKRQFPISLVVVPVLGPVEDREQLRERGTVVAGLSTHRASRHFRSYWHLFPEGFPAFSELVSKTWPGMQISAPELDHASAELSMFCLEDRMTREIYWVGFGFQIWCQLLTHLSRASSSTLIVVDEPEVYLHPDVQRQLLGILRDIGADTVLATHSGEIISEADPNEIIMIDKRRQSGERIKDVAGVQRALDAVGSSQNITLTALARSRRILFVEGLDDFRLFRRIARKMGLQELSSGAGIIPLASGGFSSWQRITILASGIAEALGAPLIIGAVYDRDFFCDEQISEIVKTLGIDLRLARVLERKEIENYLLIPSALDRAVRRACAARQEHSISTVELNSEAILDEITRPMKSDIFSQFMARRHDYFRHTGMDGSNIYKVAMISLEEKWDNFDSRMCIVPGKETLRQYRQRVQDVYGVTLTDNRIVEAMNRDEIPSELVDFLRDLDKFRVEIPI